MARACEICGKSTTTGNQISHSHRKTRRRWLANLQRLRILVGTSPRRTYVCTACLKSGRVRRAL